VQSYFGSELLYLLYEFYDRFKQKPKNWLEVFEFLKFAKVKSIDRDIAMSMAKAGQGGNNG
jgi:UDP-N-acetylglucosamine transferase subunit ALG13